MTNPHKPKSKTRSWFKKLLAKKHPQNRAQLMEILREAQTRDVLSTEILGMIERIFQVSEMQVREVMVPKSQMVVIKEMSSLQELLPLVIESGHSRFPIVDESGEDIVGILLAKDLLKYSFDQNQHTFSLTECARSATFTSQSKRLDILLREFRVNRNHLAIVLDEYGYIAGLVTIEDVLEQIVGEIEDEYDIEEEDGHIKQLPDGSYIVKASTTIHDFNEYFETNFSAEEFDTIGGIIAHGFGHLPARGETIKLHHLKFKVLHSDNRRLYLLEVKKTPARKKS